MRLREYGRTVPLPLDATPEQAREAVLADVAKAVESIGTVFGLQVNVYMGVGQYPLAGWYGWARGPEQ